MGKFLFDYFLLALFIFSSEISVAQQKNIVISDALSKNTEKMKVKMESVNDGIRMVRLKRK